MKRFHESVLLREAIGYLGVKRGGKYIDATAGGGGYSFEILRRGGQVLVLDRDPEAIEHIRKQIQTSNDLILVNDNFSHIYKIAKDHNFLDADGIIFDLGVSSYQLEKPDRGFSFLNEGPLDMRMSPELKITAHDLVNNLEKRRLYEIFKTYGQEKHSRSIVDAIFSARQLKPIETTGQLARIISEVYRSKNAGKLHPATRVFLALRIVVNSELLNLEEALPQTVKILKKGGRLVIVSFHSLEDAIVKRFFKRDLRFSILNRKPIGPQKREILSNPRSRSAKLRAYEVI